MIGTMGERDDEVWDVFESPLGPMVAEAGPAGLTGLSFPGRRTGLDPARRVRTALAPAFEQLAAYFAGELRSFELALDLRGTDSQLRVWSELRRIPYGETTSYGEIGRRTGLTDPRSVGACVGATPVPIIVPCHRVIAADGSLRGYGGGLGRKRALLALERSRAGGPPPAWAIEQLELA